jgi:hypothetical protein
MMAHVQEFQEADVVYSIPACKPDSNENCKLTTNWSLYWCRKAVHLALDLHPFVSRIFCLNVPSHFTLLLNLRSLILSLTSLIWLRTWTLPEEYESLAHNKAGFRPAHGELRQAPCAHRLLHSTALIYIYLSFFLFYLQTPRWHAQWRRKKWPNDKLLQQ